MGAPIGVMSITLALPRVSRQLIDSDSTAALPSMRHPVIVAGCIEKATP
jgi:hypothetical protein